VEGDRPVNERVVPIATQELIAVLPQFGPLNASTKALLVVKLLPPAARSLIRMSTAVQPAGVVNVYQTSYFVPVQEPLIPELVARYKVPDVATHVVFGVIEMGAKQSSDCCANENFEPIVKISSSMPVRAVVIGDMVSQGF
jgi:hypothetical protein